MNDDPTSDFRDAWDMLTSVSQTVWADPKNHQPVLLAAAGVLAIFFLLHGARRLEAWGKEQERKVEQTVDKVIHRPTNSPWLHRFWWRLQPPVDLMQVDGLAINRTRKPHCGWFGPTGAGKSAAVATVRVNGARPTLVATPDISDPMRDTTRRLNGFIWTACESDIPVDFLIGQPTEVAERLTEVFRSGGVGAWKRTTRRAVAEVIRHMDADAEPRSLVGIGRGLEASVARDREMKTICGGWVERFLDLADQFGPSIGAGGLDLSELLRAGKTALLEVDAFAHPSLGGDVVALALAEAKRCANLVPGGFRLVFEEAGQLGDRIELAEPFHRAGRRRLIAVDDITQAESDLNFHGNDGITANLATRVYFAQELGSLQRVAADRLGIKASELEPSAMADYTAWVAHGRIRRLVKFPKPQAAPAPGVVSSPAGTVFPSGVRVSEVRWGEGLGGSYVAAGDSAVGDEDAIGLVLSGGARWMLPSPKVEPPDWVDWGPMVRGPVSRGEWMRLGLYVWLGCTGTEYEEGHWLWTGPVERDGYGTAKVYVLDEVDGVSEVRLGFRTHKVLYEAFSAAFPEMAPAVGSGTVGHECGPVKDRRCCNAVRHLVRQSWSENSKSRWADQKARTGTTKTGPRKEKAG